MLHKELRALLRTLSLGALVSSGLALCAAQALAEQTPAHVDLSQPHLQPPYPDSALAAGEQGTTLVDVYVRPNGRISKFRVARSSGFGDLDNAAVESVLNWRFIPAIQDGDPVSDWTTVKVVFQLPQPAAAQLPQSVK
ncbi:MAG TPA: energy transducer TonB [Rhizomicrobium sp.]